MTRIWWHRDECRVCQSCGIAECYHVAARPQGRCWVDVRGPACGVPIERLREAPRTCHCVMGGANYCEDCAPEG